MVEKISAPLWESNTRLLNQQASAYPTELPELLKFMGNNFDIFMLIQIVIFSCKSKLWYFHANPNCEKILECPIILPVNIDI